MDAGDDDGDAVGDPDQSAVPAIEVGAGRLLLVTDVELVILHWDGAVFDLVAHLSHLPGAVTLSGGWHPEAKKNRRR
ncbi:hypothetical protein [Streptomyces sp. NPDC003015]